MAFEEIIKNAYNESVNGIRKGDKEEEVLAIQNYIKNAKRILVANKNETKPKVINKCLKNFGLPEVEHLKIDTNLADLNRTPAIAKCLMAVDQSESDIIIARGRLGLPGSGSMLIFMDNKGRILTGGFSPSHVVHKKSLEEAVYDETKMALERVGFKEINNINSSTIIDGGKCQTGITSEVLTIKSNLRVIDIINTIINKKSLAILNWIKPLENIQLDNIVIAGSYLTGLAIANLLKTHYKNITIVDIYPNLQELVVKFPLNQNTNSKTDKINFSENIDLIKTADCVIDTTGLGGLSIEQSKLIDAKVFLIEDPIAEENDSILKDKNNMYERIKNVKSQYKSILKTKGLNTKTSGTMTLTVDILLKSINHILKKPGVLYAVSEMTFFEGLIFKEDNISKFLDLIESPAITTSTLNHYNLDNIISMFLDEINSSIISL
jgi:hypothetical protein